MGKEPLLNRIRQKLEEKPSLSLEDLAKEVVSDYIFYLMQQGNIPFHYLDALEFFLMEEFYHLYQEESKRGFSKIKETEKENKCIEDIKAGTGISTKVKVKTKTKSRIQNRTQNGNKAKAKSKANAKANTKSKAKMKGKERVLISERGQVVVEYLLITMVAVMVALAITTRLISRDTNDMGFVIFKWQKILETIATDYASESN